MSTRNIKQKSLRVFVSIIILINKRKKKYHIREKHIKKKKEKKKQNLTKRNKDDRRTKGARVLIIIEQTKD